MPPHWRQAIEEEIMVYSEMIGNTNAQVLTDDIIYIITNEIVERLIDDIRLYRIEFSRRPLDKRENAFNESVNLEQQLKEKWS